MSAAGTPAAGTPAAGTPAFIPIRPHTKNLGGFTVRRSLPAAVRKTVGPFIFFDHMGPAAFDAGQGVDVRPHPHIGLATVTYLFEGALLHRDSLGTVQVIEPGDVNWMTAGSGIVHSERTPPELRRAGSALHGIQTWVALPVAHENTAPSFEHHPARTLPVIALPGATVRLIAGRAFGHAAPATTYSEMLYAAIELSPGATLDLAAAGAGTLELAVYVVDGEVTLNGELLAPQHMGVLADGQPAIIAASAASATGSPARLMLLGGEPLDGDRFIWWNFVASSRAAIDDAKRRWRDRQFAPVPDETEWIPLPDEPKPPEPMS